MKITLYPEGCCDECNEIVHVHMDCPACHDTVGRTDLYGAAPWDQDEGLELQCLACKAVFKLIKKVPDMDEWEWERVGAQVFPIRSDK
jgi:hypothetical protein